MANMFDNAYRMGYYQGYHGEAYQNDYCIETEAQYKAKYANGYHDGTAMKAKKVKTGE